MATEPHIPQPKKFGLANILLIIGLGMLLYGTAWYGYHLQLLAARQEQIKKDYSTVNSITFGVFSIDKWRDKISDVVDNQVSDFTIGSAQKKAMQKQIEQQLHSLVHSTIASFDKPKKKTFLDKIKKVAVDKFVDEDKLQAQVPSFAKTIVDKISSPTGTQRLKDIANITIDNLEQQTYDSTEVAIQALTTFMYHKYHVADADHLHKAMDTQLLVIHELSNKYLLYMLGCVAIALLFWLAMRKQVHLHNSLFFMSLLFALVLLFVGVTSSVIEVDAQLKSLDLLMMGEDVSFANQDLFFQSKSIWEIVRTLIGQPKPDAVLVGMLILIFVIAMPVIRIVARGIHILSGKRVANSKVVRYLAFESAKWDMADVMVVGILMTFIGLNGILKSQLSNLEMQNSFVHTTTSNSTILQPGYYVFVGYVVYAMILAAILKRISPDKPVHKVAEDADVDVTTDMSNSNQ